MKIAIDTNVLIQIMQNEGATDLIDPETGAPIESAFKRAQAFIDHVEARKGVVVIPAPVVSEYLLGIDRGHYQTHLDTLNSVKSIEVIPFDQLAAIECAMLVSRQEMKQLDPNATMAKLRYDRQILAIAIAAGAKEIWTHDKQLFKKAKAIGITVKSLAHIQPKPEQLSLDSTQ